MCEKVSSTRQRCKACCSRQDRDVRKGGNVGVQLLSHTLIPEIGSLVKIIHVKGAFSELACPSCLDIVQAAPQPELTNPSVQIKTLQSWFPPESKWLSIVWFDYQIDLLSVF